MPKLLAMKTCLAAWLFLVISVEISAAPFENLGFDNPKINPQRQFDYGSTAEVLPGWQVYYNDAPQPIIGFNGTHVFPDDLTDIDLISADKNPAFTEGAYSLYVDTQRSGDFFSLVQRGDVPQDAPFLELRKMNLWELSVDGQAVKPILDTQTTDPAFAPSVSVFDLSAYAGQNVELRLSSIPSMPFFHDPSQLDSLQFIRDIPEPKIDLLLLLGLLTLVIRHSFGSVLRFGNATLLRHLHHVLKGQPQSSPGR